MDVFKLASSNQLQQVSAIERSIFPDNPWTFKYFAKLVNCGDLECHVVKGDGHIKGYMFLSCSPGTLGIQRLVVVPEYRGDKLGRSLVEYAIDLALEAGDRWCMCPVPEYELRLQVLFRDCGFKVIQTRVDDNGGVRYVFSKEVAGAIPMGSKWHPSNRMADYYK